MTGQDMVLSSPAKPKKWHQKLASDALADPVNVSQVRDFGRVLLHNSNIKATGQRLTTTSLRMPRPMCRIRDVH